MISICEDDLSGDATRALLALHLGGMQANSPAGHVFALDLSGLKTPDVTVWTAWDGGNIAGVSALRMLKQGMAEIKSMRTPPDHLRKGVGAAMLDHIIVQARVRGATTLVLETGSGAAFNPALALYRGRGFVDADAFADYRKSAFNQFLQLPL